MRTWGFVIVSALIIAWIAWHWPEVIVAAFAALLLTFAGAALLVARWMFRDAGRDDDREEG